jgi:serine/threonine protein kinase
MANGFIQIPGYEILRQLGAGGMSTVYLALQRSLDRKVAIKVMRRSGDSASADVLQAERRFLLEGRMMAKLPHRNIVAVYDIVSNESIAYISMEYLEGGTLSDRMRSGLSLADAVSVIVQIASALDFAHAHGVVHRDLKPANIMFRDPATPVLTDFGIARYQDGSATRLTQTGMLVGTPTYMSPEQINGQPVDGRADLYSLGILFYELLAGAPPFRGDTPISVLMAHLTQPPPPLPPEFAAFQPVLDRMLAKSRDERYPGMKEFSQDLKSRLIHSDTLLTRLKLDPGLSSSEQLRALGFATSTPTGGGLRDSLLGGLPVTPRSTPSPTAIPPPATRPRAPAWVWLTTAAGVVLIALGAWLALRGHGGLSKDEQDLVLFWLDRAEQRIAANQLVAPAEDSAFAYLQKVQQKDPDNAKAQALLERIAGTLADQARQALAAGKADEAAELDNQALLMRPDDAALRKLAGEIAEARKLAALRSQARDLTQRADAARQAGRIFGDNGAYPLLRQVHQLLPDDAETTKRLEALVAEQLEAPRKALAAGEPDRALEALAKLTPYLGAEPAFAALRGEAEAAQKKQQAEKTIAALIQRGNQQLRAGHLAEPGGDNAYETLGELQAQAGDDRRVGEFAAALARALLAEAHRLDGAGQSARALDRANLALKVAPDLIEALAFQTEIQQRLGERASRIAETLGAARQAIAEQRFVPPAKDDAHAALQAVLALDPGNADARQLLAELPARIAEAARARAQSDAGAALAMVEASRKVFAQDAALAALAAKLQSELAAERAAAEARATRERIAKVLAGATPSLEQWRAAAKDLAALLAGDAKDPETLALRSRLIEALRAQLQAATTTRDFDALAAWLREPAQPLAADRAYAELLAALPGLRSKVAAAEQARLEAERGELVLNAYPWGNVEAVQDANRQPVTLPADTSTPLVLTLPAGSYRITFRHPQAAKPVQVIAKVEARKRVVASASFPTISAREYFARAGW